jgi:hypothetical protein
MRPLVLRYDPTLIAATTKMRPMNAAASIRPSDHFIPPPRRANTPVFDCFKRDPGDPEGAGGGGGR